MATVDMKIFPRPTASHSLKFIKSAHIAIQEVMQFLRDAGSNFWRLRRIFVFAGGRRSERIFYVARK